MFVFNESVKGSMIDAILFSQFLNLCIWISQIHHEIDHKNTLTLKVQNLELVLSCML